MTNDVSFRSGYVAIVGAPNVGKSTLLNNFLGFKLSIVSPKPQTTWDNVLGILNEDNIQMVFVDTPGWLTPTDPFQRFMKRRILTSLSEEADVVLWLIDKPVLGEAELAFGEVVRSIDKPLFVVRNKVDKDPATLQLEETEQQIENLFGRKIELWRVSAKNPATLAPLKKALVASLPVSPPYYPVDQWTNRWERDYVCELIREKVFEFYKDEIPHACAVKVEEFKERDGRKDYIQVKLFVEKEGVKGILLGGKGRSIKRLGEVARGEIERRLGRPVFLDLVVKVHKNWRKDEEFLRKMYQKGDF